MSRLLGNVSRMVTYVSAMRVLSQRAEAVSAAGMSLRFFSDKFSNNGLNGLGQFNPVNTQFPMPGGVTTDLQYVMSRSAVKIPPLSPDILTTPLRDQSQLMMLANFISSQPNEEETMMPQSPTEDLIPVVDDQLAEVECRAQDCPQLLKKVFQPLFPDRLITDDPFTVVTVSHKTKHDMTLWSPTVGEEREAFLEKFISGAMDICEAVRSAGYWADFIDPTCGQPYYGVHTNSTLFESDDVYRNFGFNIEDLGCCKVIKHHIWGTHAYIGTIFTNAPMDSPIMNALMGSETPLTPDALAPEDASKRPMWHVR